MVAKPKGLDDMMKAALVATLGGNQQEMTTVNVHTQAIVPLVQALLLAASIMAGLCGLWLLGGGTVALVKSADSRADLLLAAGLLWLLIGAWLVAGTGAIAGLGVKSGLAARFLLLVVAVTGTLATLDLIRLVSEFSMMNGLRLLGGLSLVIMAGLLIWRFANELINPLYPRPPAIDMIREIMAPQQAAQKIVKVPTPVRMNGTQVADLDDEQEEEAAHYVSDHELLMEFVERAASIGLQRARWLAPGAPEYLGGVEVTRGTYNRMIALAGRWGIVRPGGGGKPTEWNVDDPAVALQTLRLAWESVNG